MFFGKTKVKLQLQIGGPTISNSPNANKVRTAEPFRFRLSYGATIDPGIDTFLMTRDQIDKLQMSILEELGAQGATVNAGAEKMVANTIERVEDGSVKIIQGIQSVRRLTHPDVLMLIDMKRNSDYYVPSKSAFFKQFKSLADKVLDLSFCALGFSRESGPKGIDMSVSGKIPASVVDFTRVTKDVTRGMDQFVYDLPNLAYTSPYVNFSVIPNDANYSQVRFPRRFNRATEQMEKIPKTDFLNTYLFYVNELFNTYRRYLRLIGFSERLAPVLNIPSEASLPDLPPSGDDLSSLMAESVESSSNPIVSQEQVEEAEAEEARLAAIEEQRALAESRQAELSKGSSSSSSSDPSKSSDLPAPPAGEAAEEKGLPEDSLTTADLQEILQADPVKTGNALAALKTASLDWPSLRNDILNAPNFMEKLESTFISVKVKDGSGQGDSTGLTTEEAVMVPLSALLTKKKGGKTRKSALNAIVSKFGKPVIVSRPIYAKYAKKSD